MADLRVAIVLSLQDNATAPLRGFGDAAEKAGGRARSAFNLAASLNQSAEAVQRFSRMAQSAVREPIDSFREYSKGIAEVSTLVDEATFATEDIDRISREMGRTFGDLNGQASALYQTISAGALDAASATTVLGAANKLAVGGVTDTETAVDGLTSALNAWGIEAERSGEVTDSFFVAVRAGKTTVAELALSIGRVAPIAAAMGISLDETNAAIAAMTKQGINTREAVTGLKAALSNVVKPTTDAQKEAKRLGIQFDQAALRSQGLSGFLDSITSSSEFTNESMSKLFGSIEGVNAILALSKGDSQDFNEILTQMGEKAGSTTAAYEKMAGTVDFRLKQLDAKKDLLMVEFGETLMPMLEDVLPMVEEALEAVGEWVRENPELAASIGKVLGVMAVAGPPLAALALGVSTLATVSGLARGAVGLLNSQFTGGSGLPAVGRRGALAMGAVGAGIGGAILVAQHFERKMDDLVAKSRQLTEDIGNASQVTSAGLSEEEIEKRVAVLEKRRKSASDRLREEREKFGVGSFGLDMVGLGAITNKAVIESRREVVNSIDAELDALKTEKSRRRLQMEEDMEAIQGSESGNAKPTRVDGKIIVEDHRVRVESGDGDGDVEIVTGTGETMQGFG